METLPRCYGVRGRTNRAARVRPGGVRVSVWVKEGNASPRLGGTPMPPGPTWTAPKERGLGCAGLPAPTGGCQQDLPHPQRVAVPAAASSPEGHTLPGAALLQGQHKGHGSAPWPSRPALDPQKHEHPGANRDGAYSVEAGPALQPGVVASVLEWGQ